MAYIKRLAMPKTWPLARKGNVYVARPLPGRKLQSSMPLSLIIKHLGFVKTTKEVKFVLNSGRVKVNNKLIKEKSFAIGIFDVVSFPSIKKSFRLLFNNGKLFLHPIKGQEENLRPAKIINKTSLKGNKLQVNLDDGTNILSDEPYKVGDTLILDEKGKVSSHIKLDKGAIVYILGGKYIGESAKILEIKEKETICDLEGKKVNVLKRLLIAIGKDKPIISLTEGRK